MLPSNFTQLEYIQSSGTQYVDTGFVPNQDTRVVCDCEYFATSSASWLFGVRVASGRAAFAFLAYEGKFRTDYNNSYSLYFDAGTTKATHIDKVKNVTVVNGSETINDTYAAFNSQYSLFLLAVNTAGTTNGYSAAKIKSCKIYDNDVLVRDYIPCMTTNGAVGLWDNVNSEFYGNSGTGVFAAGPVVPQEMAESDIVELEYIESAGTQCVDTEFMPNQNTRVVIDAFITEYVASYLYGSQVSSGTNFYASGYTGETKLEGWFSAIGTISVDTALKRRVIDHNKNILTTDDGYSLSFSAATFQSSNTMFLFGINNGSLLAPTKAKFFSCQLYDNGVLIRNFIPAKTVAGEIGLYDKVFKEFYRNAGSGVFTAGPEIPVESPVVPENFRMVRASRTAISLAWDAVENATSYQLNQNGARVLDANVTSYTASGLSQETEYTFSLAAVNRGGSSEAVTLTAKTTGLIFITDRTKKDVASRNDKGTYGASDLIRVGDAVSYLQGLLEQLGHLVPVDPKVDWTEWDWPTPSTMQRYLQDVETVRSKLTLLSTTPKTPDSMDSLTFAKANDIEQILLDVDTVISVLKKTVVPCGATACGGDYL